MNPQEPEPLRIRQIRIDGLFGLYNHCINLNLKERVTILHGPNGVGKTVTLRMVDAFAEGFSAIFAEIPFDQFSIGFTDGSSVRLVMLDKKSKLLQISLTSKTGDKNDAQILTGNNLQSSEEKLYGVTSRKTLGRRRSSRLDRDDYNIQESKWPIDFTHIIHTHFIETQRLLHVFPRSFGLFLNNAPELCLSIMECARDINSRIQESLASYGQKSQTLEHSLPQRLLALTIGDLQDAELRERMAKVEAQRQELQEIGILGEIATPLLDASKLDELIAQEKKMMTLYVIDSEQKLSVLADLARRIRLLINSINTKFKNKRLLIDLEKGFVVTNDANQILDLDSLSSGEQHEIVMLYDLLFRIKPNTLVLIDEPELSLHVVWQKRFLPDLLKIAEVAQIDVLIATHSPYIIGDYTDLMVALETGASHA